MMRKFYQSCVSIGRFIFVLLILLVAFSFAMFQGGVVSWTIFYAVLPFALYSLFLFFYPLFDFSAERVLSKKNMGAGNSLHVDVILSRKIPFPLLYTIVRDPWKNSNSPTSVIGKEKLILFTWRRTLIWTYEVEKVARGEYEASEIQLEVTDFFGWIRKRKTFPVTSTVLVYPKTANVLMMPLTTNDAGGMAVTPYTMLKDTNVVTGVREYEEGDRMSWIHWKSFARTQTLMTKEFEHRGSENFHLVFDNRMAPTFEAQVTFAASILQEMWKERLAVQFLPIHQTVPLITTQSDDQFRAILIYLAKVQQVTVSQLIPESSFKRALDREGVIVVITSRIDEQLITLLTPYIIKRRAIICFVFVKEGQAISSIVQEEMRQAKLKGITVQLIKNEQFTDAFKEVVSR